MYYWQLIDHRLFLNIPSHYLKFLRFTEFICAVWNCVSQLVTSLTHNMRKHNNNAYYYYNRIMKRNKKEDDNQMSNCFIVYSFNSCLFPWIYSSVGWGADWETQITSEHQRKSKPNVQRGFWWSHVPHPPISRASLLTETVLSAQAGESRPRRSLYTLLSMIAAIKQPAVLLAVKDHLCTPPSQCTVSSYLFSHTVCAQKTHAWHFALCAANIQPDRAGKLSVSKASYDKDRHMILEQERESIFPSGLFS